MAATSRPSLRPSARPPPPPQETLQLHPRRSGQPVLIEQNGTIDGDSNTTKHHIATQKTLIPTSTSLPALRTKVASPPPSAAAPPPRRRSRAPLSSNNQQQQQQQQHQQNRASAAQTTLDGFFKRDISQNPTTTTSATVENEQPPAKKARRMNTTASNAKSDTAPKQSLQSSRDSPDPLDILTPSNEALRSSRHASQKQVIIADDNVSGGHDPRPTAAAASTATAAGAAAANEKREQTANVSERRSLRSHDGGSRSKSELALYFPNYEQIISLEPVKPEFLEPETVVALMDDLTEPPLPSPESSPSRTRKRKQQKPSDQVSPFGNPLLELHQVEKVEFPPPPASADNDDPLSDDIYFKAHRRHERQEKQLRNIEKERAQHEKIQLDRLLDELQGHDWLRVMGISGITDSEKKLYEPKRDHFVREVSALIDKFRVWKEEEKRRKLEREQTLLEAAAAAAAATEQAADQSEQDERGEKEEEEEVQTPDKSESYGTPPDPNDVDAWAARQLLQEARSASSTTTGGHAPRRRLVDELTRSPQKARSQKSQKSQKQPSRKPPPPTQHRERTTEAKEGEEEDLEPKPFVSFYPKRHLRDAALSARRGGRHRSAFGQPLPDIEEREFRLPSYILTDDVIHATERKRRRLKRESRG